MFLAPFALTIFGFSTSSGSNVRFSRGASAGAASGLLGLAGFFAGFVSAVTGVVVSGAGVGCAASPFTSAGAAGFSSAFGFFGWSAVSALSAFGFAGFLCSAILIKPCLLLLQGYGSRRPFCAAPCACAHLSMFAVHARVVRDGVVAHDNN